MWQDFIRQHAEHRADHIALVDRTRQRTYSYAELEQEIVRLAGHLLALGVQSGDRVVFVSANSVEHVTLFFACAKLGAILVPLNHRLARAELADIIDPLQPVCLLGNQDSGPVDWPDLRDVTTLDGPPPANTLPTVEIPDDQVMMILYTSGSTGQPKGVMFHAAMIMANMLQTVAADVLRPTDISMVNTPFFHTGGYHVFCLPLLSIGGTLILHPRFDAGQVLAEIRDAGVTVFWAVPTMFQAMYEHPDWSITSHARIRFFLSGGAPLGLTLIQNYHRHGIPFKQGFGLTEVGPNCFLLETRDAFDHPDSIGKPMPHSQVLVVDGQGEPVGPHQVGELWIAGPHRCKGYWQNEALFQKSVSKDGYFATGDLVRVDEAGFFYVVGRKKEMYISGGENIYPGEVEKQIARHADVLAVVVVGVPHAKWGEVGVAFCRTHRLISLEEMRAFLHPCLARYKHPHALVCLTELPLLANGKINRPALKARGEDVARQSGWLAGG